MKNFKPTMKFDTSLFDYTEKQGIVIDDQYLSPDYIPDTIICRDDQKAETSLLYKPLFKNNVPNWALVGGPVGSGKTLVMKYVGESLVIRIKEDRAKLEALNKRKIVLQAKGKKLSDKEEEQLKQLSFRVPDLNIECIHVNCRESPTPSGILFNIISLLNPNVEMSRRGTSIDTYYQKVYNAIQERNLGLIIYLDEIDFMKGSTILYNFSRAKAEGKIKGRQFITVIGITNIIRYEEKLDARIRSSTTFDSNKIEFPPYSVDDIYQILKERILQALAPDSIDWAVLEKLAVRAHDSGGDVRRALKVLKASAENAERDGRDKIEMEDMHTAFEIVNKDEMLHTVKKLTRRQQIVLIAILKLLAYRFIPTTGQITMVYQKLCEHIKLDTLDDTIVSKSISTLETFNIIQAYSSNEGRKGGNTRLVTLKEEDREQISKNIYDIDEMFEDLITYNPIEENQHIIYENNRKRGYITEAKKRASNGLQ